MCFHPYSENAVLKITGNATFNAHEVYEVNRGKLKVDSLKIDSVTP
jgi:hypothetical protein